MKRNCGDNKSKNLDLNAFKFSFAYAVKSVSNGGTK